MLGYQLKITIKNSHPPIWRRVIVPQHITFFDLDDIIEAVFGWTHSHLFAFYFKDMDMEFSGTPITDVEDNADECIDGWMEVGDSFLYTYDFGDDWHHTVKVEKVVEYDKRYPKVIKSKGSNMLENCGGLWGFYEVLDEAEPFDMESVNEEFETWDLPEVYADYTATQNLKMVSRWMGELNSLFEGIIKEEFPPIMQEFEEHENILREQVPVVESLEDVFHQYTKDDLKMMANHYGFKGYSKFNKKELVHWLKEHLLETECMKKVLKNSSEDEITLFEEAIEKKGILITDELVENSLLLTTYGAYSSGYDFYRVPVDVKEKYKEINTTAFQQEVKMRQDILKYCDAAVYLYGVISTDKLTHIYNSYEHAHMTSMQVNRLISEYIASGEPYVIKDNLLMDEDLAEMDAYEIVMKMQEEYTYYIPKDKEEFLKYGIYECQDPDENTDSFVKYLQRKYHKQEPEALMIFYEIQDGIRANVSDEQLIITLMDYGCKMLSQKKVQEALDSIRKMRNYTRVWELKGHTWQEIQDEIDQKNTVLGGNEEKIIPFPSNKKVYPNELCPCGSGKKYKYCCGKKKKR